MTEAYHDLLKTTCAIKNALCDASLLCQLWGYNGLKRKYRHTAMHLMHLETHIKNELYDVHELVPSLGHEAYLAYNPIDIRDHATKWYKTLCDACKIVAESSHHIYQKSGYQSKKINKLVYCLFKLKEKARRFLARGDEVQWMPHDLHRQDDELHEIYKKKEGKKHDS